MSESDSFIVEVTEEVRREKLFKLFKKYGWVMVLLVLGIVGGTAYNEWAKSSSQKEARLTGDLMLAAIAANNPAPLETLVGQNAASTVVAALEIANMAETAGDTKAALAGYRTVANMPDTLIVYTDLAWLKIVMLDGDNMPESERSSAYERLMAPGAPYRLLAQEQLAMQYVRSGDTEAAITELSAIVNDPGVTQTLRGRAQQLIVALGGVVAPTTANG